MLSKARWKEGIALETDEKISWDNVLDYISERISKPSFDTWFKPCKLKREGGKWFIISPNEFGRDWMESNYLSLVKDAIYEVTGEVSKVESTVEEKSMLVSDSDRKIANILDDIKALGLNEQERLFDLLKENNTPFSQPVKLEGTTRVDQLEIEVEKIKNQLAEINGTVKNS